jgi:hypothetical protein
VVYRYPIRRAVYIALQNCRSQNPTHRSSDLDNQIKCFETIIATEACFFPIGSRKRNSETSKATSTNGQNPNGSVSYPFHITMRQGILRWCYRISYCIGYDILFSMLFWKFTNVPRARKPESKSQFTIVYELMDAIRFSRFRPSIDPLY